MNIDRNGRLYTPKKNWTLNKSRFARHIGANANGFPNLDSNRGSGVPAEPPRGRSRGHGCRRHVDRYRSARADTCYLRIPDCFCAARCTIKRQESCPLSLTEKIPLWPDYPTMHPMYAVAIGTDQLEAELERRLVHDPARYREVTARHHEYCTTLLRELRDLDREKTCTP